MSVWPLQGVLRELHQFFYLKGKIVHKYGLHSYGKTSFVSSCFTFSSSFKNIEIEVEQGLRRVSSFAEQDF